MSQERKPYWVAQDDGGYFAGTPEGFGAFVSPESRFTDTVDPPAMERGWRWRVRDDAGLLLLDGYSADLGSASRRAWRAARAVSAAYRKGKAAGEAAG